MRICWFNDNRLGLVRDGRVYDVSAALKALPAPTYPAPKGDPLITHLDRMRGEIETAAKGAKKARVAVARKLAVLLLTLWRSETDFQWPTVQAA